MKRVLVVGFIAVAACVTAVGLAAQEAGARGGRGGGGGITPDASGKVTVDGCVQNAPAGSSSTSKYILSGVRATPRGAAARSTGDPDAGGAATEGTTPAAGTGAAGASATAAGAAPAAGAGGARGRGGAGGPAPAIRYQLAGEEKIITPHLNHVVEITGTLSGDPPPPAPPGPPAAPARGGGAGGGGGGGFARDGADEYFGVERGSYRGGENCRGAVEAG